MNSVQCRSCSFEVGVPAGLKGVPAAFPTCPAAGVARENTPAASIADVLVLLYYSYVDIADIDLALAWHRDICAHLRLYGRVRIASEGVNVVRLGAKRYGMMKCLSSCPMHYCLSR